MPLGLSAWATLPCWRGWVGWAEHGVGESVHLFG